MGENACHWSPVGGSLLMTFGSETTLAPQARDPPFSGAALSTTLAAPVAAVVSRGAAGSMAMPEITGPGPPEPISVPVITTLSIDALGRAPEEPAGPVPL